MRNASRWSTLWVRLAIAMLLVLGVSTAMAPAAMPAGPAGDAQRGQRLFLQCRACHTVNAVEAHGVGPNLAGVMGRKAASQTGYAYSPASVNSGLVSNPQTMDAFLKRPSSAAPGTKMVFAGMADPTARADIIAYLAGLNGR